MESKIEEKLVELLIVVYKAEGNETGTALCHASNDVQHITTMALTAIQQLLTEAYNEGVTDVRAKWNKVNGELVENDFDELLKQK